MVPMQTSKKVNVNSKDLFAKLLATENIIIRHNPNLDTAYFDTEKRILALPVLNNMDDDIYDLFVGHEVGHALFTPAFTEAEMMEILERVCKNNIGIAKVCLNAVEDARIEKAMRSKYPGLGRSFRNGYRKLWDLGFFGNDSKEIHEKFPTLNIIDRINLYYKGNIYGIQNFPLSELDESFINRIDNASTFDDIIPICIDILNELNSEKEQQEEQQQEQMIEIMVPCSGNGEEGNNGESQGNLTEQNEEEEEEGNANNIGQQGGRNSKANGPTIPSDADIDALASYVEKLAKESKDKFVYGYNILPSPNLNNIIVPFSKIISDFTPILQNINQCSQNAYISSSNTFSYSFDEEYDNFIKRNRSIISSMSMSFKRKQEANLFQRTQTAKTGRLDMNSIHTYKYNDDLFLSSKIVPKGKNHGMVMFVDWSGSMSSNIYETFEQLLSLVLFCRKCGISYEVYAFSDRDTYEEGTRNSHWKKDENANDDYFQFGGLKLLELFNSNMSRSEFETMAKIMLFLSSFLGYKKGFQQLHSSDLYNIVLPYQLNGTPLNETYFAAIDIVNNFKRRTNCQIVNTIFLTDGEGSSYGFNYGGSTNSSFGHRVKIKKYIEHKNIQYEYADSHSSSSCFRQIFKDNTNSRVIGIYLTNSFPVYKFRGSDSCSEMQKKFSKDGYVIHSPSTGIDLGEKYYDFYFIMKNSACSIALDEVFENIDSSLDNKKIVTQFVKNSKKRVNSRIIMNRFSEIVAKDI